MTDETRTVISATAFYPGGSTSDNYVYTAEKSPAALPDLGCTYSPNDGEYYAT